MEMINEKYNKKEITLDERNRILIQLNNKLPRIPKDEYLRLKDIEDNSSVEWCQMYPDKWFTPLGKWCFSCMDKDPRLYKKCTACKLDFIVSLNYKGKKMLCQGCIKIGHSKFSLE